MATALGVMIPAFDSADDLAIGKWYLIYSKAWQESGAAQGLRGQGHTVCLPRRRQRGRIRRRLADVTNALFSNYFFVAPWRVVNIGNSTEVWLEDFIDAIEGANGREAIGNYMEMQQGDAPSTRADA